MQPFEPSDGCLALRKLMANGSNGFDSCPYFRVIELPPSCSAHVWVISSTHESNSQIVGPKSLMLLNLEVSCSLGEFLKVHV
jgi:hypothetical protein